MVHLWKRGTKNEPEDKEMIWVARWRWWWWGFIWPANLTSAAFRQSKQTTENSLTTGCRGCVRTESTEIKQHTQEEKKTLGGGKIRDKLWQESSFEADSPGCCDALEASKSRKSTFLHEDKCVNYWLFFCCSSPVESCSLPVFWINVFKIRLFEAPCWLKTDVVTDAHTSAHN